MRSFGITVSVGFTLVCAAAALDAQTTPHISTGPTRAAERVVAATNARTAEITGQPMPGTASAATKGKAVAAPPHHMAAHPAVTHAAPMHARAADTPLRPRAGRAGHGPDSPREITLTRETFTYDAGGRRDPFVSLMTSGELRPMISDLRLVAVIYDPTGHSVAVLRDLSTGEQYRTRVGRVLGRMRVSAIHPKSVTFTLDEFGYSRQEVLALNDSTTVRTK
ncbi:MAG TPA: hypothetical protein VFW98_08995 [Gemmatimonadaceae bacterium]|nr:hypothetical protein [Gemmatimonadaceae bacterium]